MLDWIEELEKAATPGPWYWHPGRSTVLCGTGIMDSTGAEIFVNCGRSAGDPTDEDRNAIIALRNSSPSLSAVIRAFIEDHEARRCLNAVPSMTEAQAEIDRMEAAKSALDAALLQFAESGGGR